MKSLNYIISKKIGIYYKKVLLVLSMGTQCGTNADFAFSFGNKLLHLIFVTCYEFYNFMLCSTICTGP